MAIDDMDAGSAAKGAASGAAAGAAFGPWGMAAGAAIGLGLEAWGAYDKYKGSEAQTKAQVSMIGIENRQDDLRRELMETHYRRSAMQVLRANQQARSMALQAGTNQGAQFGSGLAGGYGQISGESGTNLVGLNQDVMAGRQMFGLQGELNQQKIAYAQAGGQIAQGSGMASLGQGVLTALPYAKSLFGGGFGGSGNSGNSGQNNNNG